MASIVAADTWLVADRPAIKPWLLVKLTTDDGLCGWGEAYALAARERAIFYCALSALELALWDLAGKLANLPVHGLLGGALRARIPLYANSWTDGPASIAGVVERAARLQEQGYDCEDLPLAAARP